MPQTRAQRNRLYLKKYAITVDEYEVMETLQRNRCAACGRPPKKNKLAVDHWHGYRYVKIQTRRTSPVKGQVVKPWFAQAEGFPDCYAFGDKKNFVIQVVRQKLKKKSVRGLLCFPCNSGLRKFSDNPAYLRGAAAYLEKYNEKDEVCGYTTDPAIFSIRFNQGSGK